MKLPRWLRIALIVVAVLILVALIVPFFIDVDSYRGTIIAAIEKETGRKAQIGKIRARLIPSVGFVIEDFRIGNPLGFPEGNVLSVEAIRGSLAWLPLFSREFQLSSIELVRPKLSLLEDSRGRTNYDFSSGTKTKQPAAQSSFSIADIDSIELSSLELVLGRVVGRRVVPSLSVTGVSVELGNIALDAKRLKQWTADADLDGVRLQLGSLKTPIEFHSGSARLRNAALDCDFRAALGKVADVKGTVRVANVEKGLAEFNLSTPLLDLAALLAASGGESAPATAPVAGPSELLARGKISAARVRYAPYEATDGRADVRIFTDRLEIAPMQMSLYGGTLAASLRMDQRQMPERLSGRLGLKQVNLAKLMAATPGMENKITGTGELDLDFNGSMGPGLADSLTGGGNLAIRDGKLPGVNLSSAMKSVVKILGGGSASSDSFSGETPFRSITADLALGSGRVASQKIFLDSPSSTVEMRGSTGFDQTLNYDGRANLVGGVAAGNTPAGAITGILGGVLKQNVNQLSVPFALRGTLESPKLTPGRGLPSVSTSTTQQQAQPADQKKKSILDLFKKP